jgi:hypothetical protein
MAAHLPAVGGAAIQTEDEIAALGIVIGAGYAGVRAMTATSGPGLSLMTETLGLAGMAEIPAVIVAAQRPGPSVGMPTRHEQGDLLHMDNGVYGNTKGQTSPTTGTGTITPSSPGGAVDEPVHPLRLALAAGITYLAQGVSSDVPKLARLVEAGIRHRGFALINVFSPCPPYDRLRTYQWWRAHLINLDADAAYRPESHAEATDAVMTRDGSIVGLVYREEGRALDTRLPGFSPTPLADEELAPGLDAVRRLLDEEYAP